MRILSRFRCVALRVIALGWLLVSACRPQEDSVRSSILGAEDGPTRGEYLRALFKRDGPAGAQRLKRDVDIGIALQAYWELARARPEHSDSSSPGASTIDAGSAAEFLSVLQRRGGVSVPTWWRKAIEGTRFYSGALEEFKTYGIGRMVLITGRGEYRVRRTGLEMPFALVYTPSGRSGERWTSTVWGTGLACEGLVIADDLEVVKGPDIVAVFGVQHNAAYVEGFMDQSGDPIFRFATNLWSDRGAALR